jgi:WD40 repeat protein
LAATGIQPAWAQSKDSAVKVKVELLANLEGQDGVRALAFSPDGRILATGEDIGVVWLWAVSKAKRNATLNVQAINMDALTFSPDGKRLAVTSGAESLKIWDLNNGRKVLDLKDRSGGLWCVAFSEDGKIMATGGMRLGSLMSASGVVKWRETNERAPQRTLAVHDGPIQSIDFSPDGKTLALATEDGWGGLKMSASAWSDIVAALATRGRSSGFQIKCRGALKVVDLGVGRVVKSMPAHEDSTDVVKFSPDGRTLATGGGDGMVKLWDTATWKPRYQLKGHQGTITSLAFSPDGKLLASADDTSVGLWDVASGSEIREASKLLKGGTSVAFSRQGILATGWQQQKDLLFAREFEKCVIRLWRVETSQPTNPE